MATDLTTANVIDTKSGTGWTIDVTNCNLLSDLSIKDFIVLFDGVQASNTDFTKTSQTVLTYGGVSIGSTTVEVRRVTPNNRFQEITFAEKFSSTVYNEEIDRVVRKAYEYSLNGIGGGFDPGSVNLAANEAITGNWTAPTQTDGDNSTRLATTAYTDTRVSNALSTSPALGGTPTTPTASTGTNTTQIASTAFVNAEIVNDLSASPALGGTPTAPTAADTTDTTQIATTAFVQSAAGRGVEFTIIEDQKTVSTSGGGNTAATWVQRALNTEAVDEIGTTLAGSAFTLPGSTKPGKYLVRWSCPGFAIGVHKTRLVNNSGPTVVAYGESATAETGPPNVGSHSRGSFIVDLSSNQTYLIEHYGQLLKPTDGFGVATGSGTEVYTRVEIEYRKGT